ncbi:hypothetical protein C4J89_4014 [Pseudomonas sp. R4-35-07]|nr:hypothetical protein C4J90_3970 [Pseudomonas sp. R2-60-08W]AZF33471.1 hypothetical protein C4J89_4014 [Pseudomonas sp. R4-35-07]
MNPRRSVIRKRPDPFGAFAFAPLTFERFGLHYVDAPPKAR